MQKTPSAVLLLQVMSYIGVALVFLVEALFIYAYPAIILERKGFLGAIKRSFGVIGRMFFPTIILVFVPRLMELLYMFVKGKQQGLMNLTSPEITLVILGAGIILTFITDSLVFLSTANLFILKQETEKGA
jgi:membrane-anchored glycerophosphoryl diester phosphodiesterase (GDPDase)